MGDVTLDELFSLLGDRDVTIYRLQKEVNRLTKELETKDKDVDHVAPKVD